MNIHDISPTPSPEPYPHQPTYGISYDFKSTLEKIQAYVILSLLLNCFLFSCAWQRRRTRKTWVVTLISSAYFLADWVAPYTIGLMSVKLKNEKRSCDLKLLRSCDPDVLQSMLNGWHFTFWAPFLLLHLGGPDNVTSLSAEENNMWLQQLVRLISQTVSTILMFLQFAQFAFFRVSLASYMVFLAGAIRYMERVHSLYLARSGGLKESSATRVNLHAGPDFPKLSETLRAMREANLCYQVETVQLPPKKFKPHSPSLRDVELDFDTTDDPLDKKSLLQFALCFYDNFKGLFFAGGVSFSHEQRHFTRSFFLERSSRDAFKLAELELSFIHKDLHTKSGTPRLDGNPVARILTTLLISAAAVVFFSSGTLWEIMGILNRALRRYAWYGQYQDYRKRQIARVAIHKRLLMDMDITYALVSGALFLEIVSLLMVLLSGRNMIAFNYYDWIKPIADATVKRRKSSESFSKCNFISYHLHYRTPHRVSSVAEFLFIGPALEAWKLKRRVTSDTVPESLKDKIFTELKMRSQLAQTVEIGTKICSQRGDWSLVQNSCYRQLKWSIGDVEYGHSFLLWHIATDLVCHISKDCDQDADRKFCKDISEYLFYLYLAKPTIIAAVAGNSVKVFLDTVLAAKKFFQKRLITDHAEACEAILSVNTDIEPVIFKGDASESVLFDACRLAKQLLVLKEGKRWTLMSGVWMELLTYAAFHSKGTDHAQQPSQGGELLTFVWLLMNHLGLGKQFEEERVRTGYRIIVRK